MKAVDDGQTDKGEKTALVYVDGKAAGRIFSEWRGAYRAWRIEGITEHMYYTKATAIHACATAFKSEHVPKQASPYRPAPAPPSKDPHDVVDKINRAQSLASMVEDMAKSMKEMLAMLNNEVTGDESVSKLVRRIPTREQAAMND